MLFQIFHTLLQNENLEVSCAKLAQVQARLYCLPVPSTKILIEGVSLVLLCGGGELKEAGLLWEEDVDATIEGLVEFEVGPLIKVKICSNLYLQLFVEPGEQFLLAGGGGGGGEGYGVPQVKIMKK